MASISVTTTEKNESGIPKAIFLDDVDQFMTKNEGLTVTSLLRQLEEEYQKYKYMEQNLTTKKDRLKFQIPELKSSLNLISFLESKKESDKSMNTQYQLADSVYMKATVPPTDKVCLWLGANVMLEYNLDEARVLLKQNQESALKALSSVQEDLAFLRDQTTTIEVNMARVYNWDVKRRQKLAKTS